MELVRQLMTAFEEMPITGYTNGRVKQKYDLGPDYLVRLDHVRMMIEAGLIEGKVIVDYFDPPDSVFEVLRVTWKGHDFLDATRNPSVWAKTTERAKKAGSWTFDLLLEFAKEEVRRRIFSVAAD